MSLLALIDCSPLIDYIIRHEILCDVRYNSTIAYHLHCGYEICRCNIVQLSATISGLQVIADGCLNELRLKENHSYLSCSNYESQDDRND